MRNDFGAELRYRTALKLAKIGPDEELLEIGHLTYMTLRMARLCKSVTVCNITGINLGMGGPTSIKAFMMIMIGGAGVTSGAIAGGFILGMMESVGLSVLAAYGDITYLVIFASLMIFLAIRPQGLMGKPWG